MEDKKLPSTKIILSTLSSYAIPSKVAPQQSFGPLYAAVNVLNYSLLFLFYFLTKSFLHVCNTQYFFVNDFHDLSTTKKRTTNNEQ
jgi:hypothetical protein